MKNRAILAFGVNMSYRLPKEALLQLIKEHWHILSGDDDLMLQSLSGQGVRIHFSGDIDAYPHTQLPETFPAFIKQRLRHLGAGKRYFLFPRLFYSGFIGTWTILLIFVPFISFGAAVLLGKILLDAVLFYLFARKYKYQFDFPGLVLLEIGYIPYVWLVGIFSRIIPARWR